MIAARHRIAPTPEEIAMHAPNLPEPWVIAEVERQRRTRESHCDDRPSLELLPPPPPRDAPEEGTGRTVIVIELW